MSYTIYPCSLLLNIANGKWSDRNPIIICQLNSIYALVQKYEQTKQKDFLKMSFTVPQEEKQQQNFTIIIHHITNRLNS